MEDENRYLVRLIRVAKAVCNFDFFPGSTNLTRTEFQLLQEVIAERSQGKDIISSELARRLGITRSAVSQTVAKLEKRGVIKRMASEYDKKIAYIRLSDKCAEIYESQCKQAAEFLEAVVMEFGIDRFHRLLDENDALIDILTKKKCSSMKESTQNEGGAATCSKDF